MAEQAAREAPAVAAASRTTSEPSWLQQIRVAQPLPPPPAHGSWEVAASRLEELQVLGAAWATSSNLREQLLGRVIQQQVRGLRDGAFLAVPADQAASLWGVLGTEGGPLHWWWRLDPCAGLAMVGGTLLGC